MHATDQEFAQSITALTYEILARVEEVGLQQAAEEHWAKAKTELEALFARIEESRREHHLPEDEL